jgi:hypothetical protein
MQGGHRERTRNRTMMKRFAGAARYVRPPRRGQRSQFSECRDPIRQGNSRNRAAPLGGQVEPSAPAPTTTTRRHAHPLLALGVVRFRNAVRWGTRPSRWSRWPARFGGTGGARRALGARAQLQPSLARACQVIVPRFSHEFARSTQPRARTRSGQVRSDAEPLESIKKTDTK